MIKGFPFLQSLSLDLLQSSDPSHTPLWKKIIGIRNPFTLTYLPAGAVSGAIGSAIANPTDLVKVTLLPTHVRYVCKPMLAKRKSIHPLWEPLFGLFNKKVSGDYTKELVPRLIEQLSCKSFHSVSTSERRHNFQLMIIPNISC